MGWDVDKAGLGVVFDRSIPELVRETIGEAIATALVASDLRRDDIGHYWRHPGGAKVVAALETALGLASGSLIEERGSSATSAISPPPDGSLREPLVVCGPFRLLHHPNCLLVAAEIVAAPMVLGLPRVAALASC